MIAQPRMGGADVSASTINAAWTVVGVAVCYAVVIAVFWPTSLAIAKNWSTNTYEHCALVIPISLWLVWRQRAALAAAEPRLCLPGLIVIAIIGLVWLAAEVGGVSAPGHVAVAAMIPASVLLVFGPAWSRILLFPLAFVFFAVPIGDGMIPALVDRTADFVVSALRLSGIPVYREGAHFVIPSGRWSVVEACSGIRFLLASIMAGSLYAYLMYRSARRRLLFVLASIALPIFANWLRAYITVLIAHLTSNQWMAGDEHITFGYILFSGVLLLSFWIGARWREDEPTSAAVVEKPGPVTEWRGVRQLPAAFAVLFLALACWPLAAHLLLSGGDARPVDVVPIAAAGGWKDAGEQAPEWTPHLIAPAATHWQMFERDGKRVGVWVGFYRNQDERSKLANSYNSVAGLDRRQWRVLKTMPVSPDANALDATLSGTLLQGKNRILVWQWYWLGNQVTTSLMRAKVDLAITRLMRRSDASAWIAVFTPADEDPTQAQATLAAFLKDNAATLDAALKATAQR